MELWKVCAAGQRAWQTRAHGQAPRRRTRKPPSGPGPTPCDCTQRCSSSTPTAAALTRPAPRAGCAKGPCAARPRHPACPGPGAGPTRWGWQRRTRAGLPPGSTDGNEKHRQGRVVVPEARKRQHWTLGACGQQGASRGGGCVCAGCGVPQTRPASQHSQHGRPRVSPPVRLPPRRTCRKLGAPSSSGVSFMFWQPGKWSDCRQAGRQAGRATWARTNPSVRPAPCPACPRVRSADPGVPSLPILVQQKKEATSYLEDGVAQQHVAAPRAHHLLGRHIRPPARRVVRRRRELPSRSSRVAVGAYIGRSCTRRLGCSGGRGGRAAGGGGGGGARCDGGLREKGTGERKQRWLVQACRRARRGCQFVGLGCFHASPTAGAAPLPHIAPARCYASAGGPRSDGGRLLGARRGALATHGRCRAWARARQESAQ
mgnify:CR=1 FL=1